MGLAVLRTARQQHDTRAETLGGFGHEPSVGEFDEQNAPDWLTTEHFDFVLPHAFEQRAAAQARIQPKRGVDGYFGKTLRLDAAAAPHGFQTAWRAAKYAEDDERLRNIKNVFEIKAELPKACNILLIDDVFTTGSTLNNWRKR